MSICVCAQCKKPWKALGSPARCPDCGQVSFAIAIQTGSQNPPTAETRAKLSASLQKHWQDPEYRTKYSTAVSIGMKRRWQDPEYRAKQIATHTGKRLSSETKAKISVAVTRRQKGEVKSND